VRVASSLVILACTASAFAQNPEAAATAEFDRGRALMKQHKYKDACAAFEHSQQLDPQNGTLFNLAECNSHVGKIATAWLAYRDLGTTDTNAGRRGEAARRAAELEKRLPKLLVLVDSAPPGLTVTINGNPATSLVGVASPVDLGDYAVHATAPGFAAFDGKTSVVDEGKTVRYTIELEPSRAKPEPVPAPVVKPEPIGTPEPRVDKPETPPTSHRTRNGAIVAAVGGVALVAGVGFGLQARSQWNDAEALCPNHVCPTTDARMRGDALVDSARGDATWSTALVVGGAAIAAAGVYLIVTAHPAPTTAWLTATSNGAMAGVGGRF
jgi:PEGA domain-containing protein